MFNKLGNALNIVNVLNIGKALNGLRYKHTGLAVARN